MSIILSSIIGKNAKHNRWYLREIEHRIIGKIRRILCLFLGIYVSHWLFFIETIYMQDILFLPNMVRKANYVYTSNIIGAECMNIIVHVSAAVMTMSYALCNGACL